ncbi:hypothetical protein L202_07145 [Cryptococcus amylolentus CBS 6039]|uniref:Uncharacterized protein n=1 Tax=Cryptococcus amylolentus CBS 6039 TaxID=1295533 RepID=A0A1E3HER6_9TREE|nr:hypothetical protein L202_07145 [Cryptococcus amylolentus CBS 6039]ODN74839.1 hypothetical protein L202_07145 [Cryptococcus amylolentus CBS 6039]
MSRLVAELTNVESRPDEAIKVEYTYLGNSVTRYLETDADEIDHRPRAFIARDSDTNSFQVFSFLRGGPDWRSYTAPCESLGEFGEEIGFDAKTSMVPLSEVSGHGDEAPNERK